MGEKIQQLEKELAEARQNYLHLWATIEAACGVKQGHFTTGQDIIEFVSRLRKVDPPRGSLIVTGWKPKGK